MRLTMKKVNDDKTLIIDETPLYYAAVNVDVMDKRKNDTAETMQIYFRVDTPDKYVALGKMKDIVKSLGYSLCAQWGLMIVAVDMDSKTMFELNDYEMYRS